MTTDEGHIGEQERQRLLHAFDKMVPCVPERDVEEVDAELASIRHARRSGGRRSVTKRRG